MIGNRIADKITSVSTKKSTKELHNNDEKEEGDVEIASPKKRCISPERRQQIIEELRLAPKKCIFLEIIDELMSTLKDIHISRRKITNYW